MLQVHVYYYLKKKKTGKLKKKPIILTSHAVDLVHVNHSTISLLELLTKE